MGRHVGAVAAGPDEHGLNIQRAAKASGVEPKTFVDQMEPRWREVWERLDISYDDYIRTTERRHEAGVTRLLQTVHENGHDDIYLGTYEGWYCVSCELYYSEDELRDGKCPVHGRPVERMAEERELYHTVLSQLQSLYQKGLLEVDTSPEVHMEGASNLLGLDLHLTRERMRELLHALEEKKRVIELIDLWLEHGPRDWLLLLVGVPESYTAEQLESYVLRNSAPGREMRSRNASAPDWPPPTTPTRRPPSPSALPRNSLT